MKRAAFISKFVSEVEAGNAAVFAGAGLSVPAGYVNWKELLRGIADELSLDIDREHDLVGVAQYHVNRSGQQRGRLSQEILEALSSNAFPTASHSLLAQLPIEVWWTTNYDKLIEAALIAEGKVPDVKYNVKQLAHTKPRRDATVYKMHGDVDHPADAVLTRDDYEKYAKERGAFINALSGDLISKTFLFIGFGFSDPNLASVLAHIRTQFAENQRPHYAIFRKEKASDHKSIEEYEYHCVKQELFLEDLRRFNIDAVLVDDYGEISDILTEIHSRFSGRYVFVSSAAADFSPWGEADVTEFMRKLGQLLTQRGFRLVTGVGLGTGNAILTGALQEVAARSLRVDDELVIRPFPQFIADEAERAAVWTAYRRDMLGRCGIAMFLFGNKQSAAGVVPATGMVEEFNIARELGLALIPVGATGSVAKDLASSIPEGNPWQGEIHSLAAPVDELQKLLGPIIDLLDKVRRST